MHACNASGNKQPRLDDRRTNRAGLILTHPDAGKEKMPRFNILLAVVLILFAVAFVLIWAFVVMPICNESGWKPPCPPKDFVS
jgi:hypothetical protein